MHGVTDDPLCAHAPYVITLGVFDGLLSATKSSTGEKFFIWIWKPERGDWGNWSMHFLGEEAGDCSRLSVADPEALKGGVQIHEIVL